MAVALPRNSENDLLEDLYNRKIKLDPDQDSKCQMVLKKVLSTVIEKAKEKSPHFKELYKETYYGGSYYDKLKVNSTDFEFDLNILFKIPKQTNWYMANLGDDVRKPNFANFQATSIRNPDSDAWNSLLIKDRQGNMAVSPKKMFEVLQTAVDRAITDINSVLLVNNERFRVTRSTGAPVILNVEGPGVKFTVDLVPSFKLELFNLKTACSDLHTRVVGMLKDFNIDVTSFMAIALKNASSESFEVDFHDIERGLLLKSGGCVYKVIKLIKYLRDTTGGTISKLWSHLLKTSVMRHVIRQEQGYWKIDNLNICFVDCIRNLWIGLQKGVIADVFFPDFNMLERVREGVVLTQACTWLDGLVKKHNRMETVSVFFPELNNRCLPPTDNLIPVKAMQVTVVKKELTNGNCNLNVEDTKLECRICEKSFSGIESKNEHLRSKKHLNKVQENDIEQKMKMEKTYSINAVEAKQTNERKFECKLCEKSFTGIESQEEHFMSKKHKNNAAFKTTQVFLPKVEEKHLEQALNKSMNEVFECKTCQKSFSGIESKEEHFKSRKHLNKIYEERLQVNLPKDKTLPRDSGEESATRVYCNLCEKPFTGIESEAEHMKSKKHLNKLAEKAHQNNILPKKEENKLECKICDKIFTGVESKEEHLKSKKHLTKCRE